MDQVQVRYCVCMLLFNQSYAESKGFMTKILKKKKKPLVIIATQ